MGALLGLCGRDDAAAGDYGSRATISQFGSLLDREAAEKARAVGGGSGFASCATVGLAARAPHASNTSRNTSRNVNTEDSEEAGDHGGALFRSARQRRMRLQRRNDGAVRNVGREMDGTRVDLIRQEREATTLTDSVVERLIAVSTRLGGGGGDCDGDAAPAAPETPAEQSSCDTSIYASGESCDGSDAPEIASPAVDEIIADAELENIQLFPMKRQVQTLTDAEVGALLLRSN